ncbi:hypothetical protein RRG08_007957 [Elysia crispata]|uniref:FRAS1-related extracellular matrix protein N-terminal domain-containing protein n=1 Tax=Elysia crispata TaxID=231223 RepID=A0AAE0ZQ97_9GAST|nr:hypothetical protein RRG08_007957 [Elysia crispata]
MYVNTSGLLVNLAAPDMASGTRKTCPLAARRGWAPRPQSSLTSLCGVLTSCLLLAMLPATCHAAGLVIRHRDIRVDIGRSVYLGRDDLVITTVRRNEHCRVEVVMNDPATQRVGKLHPPEFEERRFVRIYQLLFRNRVDVFLRRGLNPSRAAGRTRDSTLEKQFSVYEINRRVPSELEAYIPISRAHRATLSPFISADQSYSGDKGSELGIEKLLQLMDALQDNWTLAGDAPPGHTSAL